jgi:hypothetical protein
MSGRLLAWKFRGRRREGGIPVIRTALAVPDGAPAY